MISMGYNSLIWLYLWHKIIPLMFCLSQFSQGGTCRMNLVGNSRRLFFSGKLDFQTNENDHLSLDVIFKGKWKSINFKKLNGNCIFFFYLSVKFKGELVINLIHGICSWVLSVWCELCGVHQLHFSFLKSLSGVKKTRSRWETCLNWAIWSSRRCPYLWQGVGTRWALRSFTTQTILGFCEILQS